MQIFLNRADYGDLFCLTHMEDTWDYAQTYVREDLHAAHPLIYVTTFELKTSYMGNTDYNRCMLFSVHPDDLPNVRERAPKFGILPWAEFQRYYGPCGKIVAGC
jgi:hypothetical protein